jgi:hypothetical protein
VGGGGRPRPARVVTEPLGHLAHQAGGLQRADRARRPRAGQVVRSGERGAVGQPGRGADHVGVAARAAVGDLDDAAGLPAELGGHHRDVVRVDGVGRRTGKSREGGKPRRRRSGGVVEQLLDAQQLVVLGHAVGSGRGAGLDLAAVGGHGEVGDRGVLGLARAVAHHAAEAVAVGQVDRVEGLGQRADLVDLDQQGVGGARRCPLQSARVGDEQVVADDLDLVADALVSDAQPSQSSSSSGSSMETSG